MRVFKAKLNIGIKGIILFKSIDLRSILRTKKYCKIIGNMKKIASNNKQIQKDIKNQYIASSFWTLTTLKE